MIELNIMKIIFVMRITFVYKNKIIYKRNLVKISSSTDNCQLNKVGKV